MCGILGLFAKDSTRLFRDIFSESLHLLDHRGPDGFSIEAVNEHLLFGHTRLAINGIERGKQPLTSPDSRYTLIANGEIYNCSEILDAASEIRGYTAKTNSDCEALIAAYQMHGASEMHLRLRGMYSFLIYDSVSETLTIARDHAGIKPLYYSLENGFLWISSEAKSIPSKGTIRPFPAGSFADVTITSLEDESINIRSFPRSYSFSDKRLSSRFDPASFGDKQIDGLMKPFKDSFKKAIQTHMLSEVPICLFLSGGLDSAILCAVLDEVSNECSSQRVTDAYCVGREDSTDYYSAQLVADMYGINLTRVDFTVEQASQQLSEIIYALETDEPEVIRSSVTNYFLAKRASEDYKVVLTGEGSDELFGGYLYFHDCNNLEHLSTELNRIFAGLSHANLCRVDKMTMAHSLEARVPFLDQDVIHQASLVPSELKMVHNSFYDSNVLRPFGIEKWLLRRAYRSQVPEAIINRAKAGQCEGYSEAFVPQFIARIEQEYSQYITDPEGDAEAQIYTNILKSKFDSQGSTLQPTRWTGNCRAAGASWSSDKAKNKGLAPSHDHLWRGIK